VDDDGPYAAADALVESVAPLVDVARRPEIDDTAQENGGATSGDAADPGRLLRAALAGTGSNKTTMVGVAGFEPTASSSRTKRAAKLRHTPVIRRRV
jgi:hypothetical protein